MSACNGGAAGAPPAARHAVTRRLLRGRLRPASSRLASFVAIDDGLRCDGMSARSACDGLPAAYAIGAMCATWDAGSVLLRRRRAGAMRLRSVRSEFRNRRVPASASGVGDDVADARSALRFASLPWRFGASARHDVATR